MLDTAQVSNDEPKRRTVPQIAVASTISSSSSREGPSAHQHNDEQQSKPAAVVAEEATKSSVDSAANTPSTITPSSSDDHTLLEQAEEHFRNERLLEAARVIRNVQDQSLLTNHHRWILRKAESFEKTVSNLTSLPTSGGWTKQGESHGHRDIIIYYRLDERTRLTARIETPIEQSLLVPLLSVFNESDLYQTWMPHFEKPFKMGVTSSVKLQQNGRSNQVISVVCDMPWPLAAREAVLEAHAIDDIDRNGQIIVKMVSRDAGEEEDGLRIPPPEKGVVRVDFDGGILFRKCPSDHPALQKTKHHYDDGEDLVLVCLTMCVDPHVANVPVSVVNWSTRHVIGHMWKSLLQVAEEVRDGSRPEHAAAIDEKREFLYDWVDERVGVMLSAAGGVS